MAYTFKLPGRTVIGENALDSCEAYFRGFGKKALIVTGKIVTRDGPVKAPDRQAGRLGHPLVGV